MPAAQRVMLRPCRGFRSKGRLPHTPQHGPTHSKWWAAVRVLGGLQPAPLRAARTGKRVAACRAGCRLRLCVPLGGRRPAHDKPLALQQARWSAIRRAVVPCARPCGAHAGAAALGSCVLAVSEEREHWGLPAHPGPGTPAPMLGRLQQQTPGEGPSGGKQVQLHACNCCAARRLPWRRRQSRCRCSSPGHMRSERQLTGKRARSPGCVRGAGKAAKVVRRRCTRGGEWGWHLAAEFGVRALRQFPRRRLVDVCCAPPGARADAPAGCRLPATGRCTCAEAALRLLGAVEPPPRHLPPCGCCHANSSHDLSEASVAPASVGRACRPPSRHDRRGVCLSRAQTHASVPGSHMCRLWPPARAAPRTTCASPPPRPACHSDEGFARQRVGPMAARAACDLGSCRVQLPRGGGGCRLGAHNRLYADTAA